MALASQTPLTNIAAAQGLEAAYQPLLLAQLTFTDGTTLYLSSENLNSGTGGVQYQGNDYLARILNQDIETLQSLSDNGIVQSPEVTLELADADKFLWTNYEFAHGFKGARLKLIQVFWDAGTSTFSTDQRVMFVGTCNPANATPTELSVTATSILNMTRSFLPAVAISQLCPWPFPPDKVSRVAGATDPTSIYYQCGYSPDVTDSDTAGGSAAAVGNGSFTDCGKGWADCIARLGNAALSDNSRGGASVQIMYDESMRRTGRFGGIRYNPPSAWAGREYLTGNQSQGINNPNLGKYSDYFPQVYGTAMVLDAPVMNVEGDPNSTRFEVVVCMGQIHTDLSTPGPIQAVLVNGLLIPHISQTSDPLMAWFWVNNGSRNGTVNSLPLYDGRGDPYGSLACICVVVYKSVQDSSGTPSVNVLTKGPAVLQYPDGTAASQTLAWTDSPVWCTMNMLTRCNFQVTDLDLATFASEASYAAVPISYSGATGSGTHPRYRMGLALRQRRSLSDILKTVLAGFNAILRPSLDDGTIQLLIKKGFANQQPAVIVGSNNQSALSGGGYSAYDFAESSIKLTDGSGFEDTGRVPTLSFSQRRITDTPNRLILTYQDENYSYNSDTLIMVDSGDIARAGGQMIQGNVAAEGIVNYDQATRIIQCQLAENYRGNPRTGTSFFNGTLQNDSGGTYIATWKTTFRALHLRCGDLIRLGFAMYGLNLQPFRVTSIKPSMNYEEATITANWHSDDWYANTYGQRPAPTPAGQNGIPNRPPYGWCPNTITPVSGDALYAATDLTFSLAESYASSSTGAITAQLAIAGKLPANQLPTLAAPVFTTATADTSAGSIPAGTYFFAASAIDSSGYESALNLPPFANCTLTATGQIVLSGFVWASGTSSYKIFGGNDPFRMSLQASGSGAPSSITLTSLNIATEGAPDRVFDHFSFVATKEWHPGVFYAAISAVTSTTVTFASASFTANQFAGSVLSLIGSANNSGNLPVVDATIASNDATSITVSGVDLVAAGLKAGDVVTVRAKGTSVTSNSIADPNFASSLYTPEPPVAIQTITNASPIQVTTKTPHGYSTGDEVLLSLLYGAPKAINGNQYAITVIDSLNFTLNGSTAAGLYAGGGIVQRLNIGMRTNAEAGRMLRIISGTGAGQSYPIASNTQSSVTISGSWITEPDSTSIWIVTDAASAASAQTASASNADPTQSASGTITLTDLTPLPYFVQAFTCSAQGLAALASDTPWREIYLFAPPQNLDTGIEGVPVSTTTPSNGQTLTYNSTTGQWEGGSGRKYTLSWISQSSVTVNHDLNTTAVIVQVFDANNILIQPESVTVTDANVVTLTFGALFTGSAVVIG